MAPRVGLGIAGALLAEIVGCAPGPVASDVACVSEAVVYNHDTREEASAMPAEWQTRAASTMALIDTQALERLRRGESTWESLAATTAIGLCADERFSSQPALARCSGVLIGSDLLLTAGHCLPPGGTCDGISFVTGYSVVDVTAPDYLRDSQVFSCAEVLVEHQSSPGDDPSLDFAVVRLTRPAAAASALPRIRAQRAMPDEGLILLGYPTGAPLKAAFGRVVAAREQGDYFGADIDAFGGDSGGPVFDQQGALVGLALAGLGDFEYDGVAGCLRVRAAMIDVLGGLYERVAQVTTIIRFGCTSGVQELCDIAPVATVGRVPAGAPCEPEHR